jgi:hypothetical protein
MRLTLLVDHRIATVLGMAVATGATSKFAVLFPRISALHAMVNGGFSGAEPRQRHAGAAWVEPMHRDKFRSQHHRIYTSYPIRDCRRIEIGAYPGRAEAPGTETDTFPLPCTCGGSRITRHSPLPTRTPRGIAATA